MHSPSAHEEEIFLTALEIADEAERSRYIESTCSHDKTLRETVDLLLADHEQASTLFREVGEAITLTAPGDSAMDRDVGVGKTIGPYTLTKRLGEGGGGLVYEARQETPVRRKVALKILKLGMDTQQVIARFEAERQTLALMEHPNIARVIDAGATETGRPYFVMELVEGMRITDYCEANRVSLTERLRLMLDVCAGVQHAHQKGIIHRDLKPSNLLISSLDGRPTPKVIDFGIAKATATDPGDGTLITLQGQLIGTPAYMSPEQIQGGAVDVDTRSDVYSLGVVLYELLAGHPPFDSDELLRAGVDGMRQRLLHEEPAPPLRRIQEKSARRHRELDWIVLKSLEKDRDRRYQTVRALADDIERHLANEPVEAHPPGRWYRLGKLARRNRLASAAIAVAALTLLGGFTASTLLLLRARTAERQQARLRAEAEERARITQAAILLMQGKTAEADAEIRPIGTPLTQPSVEASSVFRDLATWNAANGRWQAAAERLLALSRVNRFDDSDMTDNATRDLVPIAPTLIQAGNLAAYQEFNRMILGRLGKTRNPVAAEHVLKICLQLPPDSGTMSALAPVAAIAEQSLAKMGDGAPTNRLDAWRCAVLGLWHFRNGRHHDAIRWCDKALMLRSPEEARHAYSGLVRAMAKWKLGETDSARNDLKSIKTNLGTKTDQPFGHGFQGVWHDWLCVRLFSDECKRLTGQANRDTD